MMIYRAVLFDFSAADNTDNADLFKFIVVRRSYAFGRS